MKDTQAMETCVSPKHMQSAESPWFKKTAIIRPYHNLPIRRNSMQSWSESSSTAVGQAVLRIADAPCDSSQDATEPERVPPVSCDDNVGEKQLAAEKEQTTVCQYFGAIVSFANPQQILKDQQTIATTSTFTPSSLVIEGKGTTVNGELWKRTPHHQPKKWMQGVSSDNPGQKANQSLSTATHSTPLTPTTSHDNQVVTSNKVQYSIPYHHVHQSTTSSASERPANPRETASSQNHRKSSNLSEIEQRQRGPLKKRHIHFQPEVLDLSVKRLKSEPGSNVMGQQIKDEKFLTSCAQSSQSVGVKPVHQRLNEGFYPTVKQEKQSEVDEMVQPETQSYRGIFRTGEGLETERLDAGITHSNQRPLPPSIQGFQPGELGTFTGTFSNMYAPGGIPAPQYNRELVRRWVLHVTQNNEMHAMQHLQAQVVPDAESNFSSAAADASQGSMVPMPKFDTGTRGHRNAASFHEKPYACEHCSSTFKHRHHVVRHMRAHNGERPFHCPDCGAAFARKCVLTNHRRTHTGEKPYICTECGDTFSRKHHLVIHQRTHSGEKPYRCLECGAAFARSHHVNRHRRTHELNKAQEESDTISLPGTARSPNASDIEHLPTTLAKVGTELMVPHPIVRTNFPAPQTDTRNELFVLPKEVTPGSPGVLTESGTESSPAYTRETPVTQQPSDSVDRQNGQVRVV
ncbi:uncharacterized protein [Asterias amurensis]|uniref:uncharacterized protein n=1 Tax=Asterias amurensis TaxID=7602 RepID=UPI003AB37095